MDRGVEDIDKYLRKIGSVNTLKGNFLTSNFRVLKNAFEEVKEQKDPHTALQTTTELNRLLYNFINSFYALTDHEDQLIKILEENGHKLEIEQKKEEIGLKELESFFKALRGYYTHVNMAKLSLVEHYGNSNGTKLQPGKNFVLSIDEDLIEDFESCDGETYVEALRYVGRFDEYVPIEPEIQKFFDLTQEYYSWLLERTQEIYYQND